jgi:hypothetical protein
MNLWSMLAPGTALPRGLAPATLSEVYFCASFLAQTKKER